MRFALILIISLQVIPLRASNLLQTELKKIVFLGNKDYMEREVLCTVLSLVSFETREFCLICVLVSQYYRARSVKRKKKKTKTKTKTKSGRDQNFPQTDRTS